MKSDMREGGACERGGGASFIKAAVHQSEDSGEQSHTDLHQTDVDRCGPESAEVTGFNELTLCLDAMGARRPLQTRIRTAATEDERRAERTNCHSNPQQNYGGSQETNDI